MYHSSPKDGGSKYVHNIGRAGVLGMMLYLKADTVITVADLTVRTR
jgi:hypothetical protein